MFGKGLLKRPPFQELLQGLRFDSQVRTVISNLFFQYVTDEEKAAAALPVIGKLVSVLNDENECYELTETRWNGEKETIIRRSADLPVFAELIHWLRFVHDSQWEPSFSLRFQLMMRYCSLQNMTAGTSSAFSVYQRPGSRYLELSDFVQVYVMGLWDKDLFYKAVFEFFGIGSLFSPVSIVEQKVVTGRNARIGDLERFFGPRKFFLRMENTGLIPLGMICRRWFWPIPCIGILFRLWFRLN